MLIRPTGACRPEAAFRLCELGAEERSFTMAYSRVGEPRANTKVFG
jgi:hypothetical protein